MVGVTSSNLVGRTIPERSSKISMSSRRLDSVIYSHVNSFVDACSSLKFWKLVSGNPVFGQDQEHRQMFDQNATMAFWGTEALARECEAPEGRSPRSILSGAPFLRNYLSGIQTLILWPSGSRATKVNPKTA